MRIAEILQESHYTDELQNDITNLLIAVAEDGIFKVETQNLLNDLQNMGYSIDEESILDVLDTIGIVRDANPETIDISLSDSDAFVGADKEEIAADTVDRLSKKELKRDKP